jgi:hypothetical protein
MLPHVAGKTPAGGSAHPGADRLHRGHQRIGEEHRPGERVAELGASLGIGSYPTGIIVGCAGYQAGAKDAKQPRLGRLDNRALSGIDGLLDLECHRYRLSPSLLP